MPVSSSWSSSKSAATATTANLLAMGQEPRSHWLRQRAVGRSCKRRQSQRDLVDRLKLEKCLLGHKACVNCLEWNRRGDLLASGSDDTNVIVWDPFNPTCPRRQVLPTRHDGNIFSVKFMPSSGDGHVATCASDGAVKCFSLFDAQLNGDDTQPLLNCLACHRDRVKRIEVHPEEPNLIWSAGEDGYIMQYDLREHHACRRSTTTKPKNLLIDLDQLSMQSTKSAKCLALNPVRSEQLAIGSDDIFVRLVDRRMVRNKGHHQLTPNEIAVFAPGHLLRTQKLLRSSQVPMSILKEYSGLRSHGVTYVAFSQDGRELLVNMHAEQAYLFNVQEPNERYKSFDTTVRPLIMDEPLVAQHKARASRGKMMAARTYSQWRELKKVPEAKVVKLTGTLRHAYETLDKKLKTRARLTKGEHDLLNQLLADEDKCVEFYQLRAGALIQRGWRGDYYQSIRDSCCALALHPLDYKSLEYLGLATCKLKDQESMVGLHDLMRIIRDEFGAAELNDVIKTMSACIQEGKTMMLAKEHHQQQQQQQQQQRHPHIIPWEPYYSVPSPQHSTAGTTTDDEDDDFHHDSMLAHDDDEAMMDQSDSGSSSGRGAGSPSSSASPAGQVWDRSLHFDYTESGPIRFLRNKFKWPPASAAANGNGGSGSGEDGEETLADVFERLQNTLLDSCHDYSQRFCGHCNMNTDIKEVNFFGPNGEFVVGGSDDGAFYVWDKVTSNLVKAVHGDQQILNCLQAHPNISMLATSGIEPSVKLWSPSGKRAHDIKSLEARCNQNNQFLNSDPLEAMIMMLYQSERTQGNI